MTGIHPPYPTLEDVIGNTPLVRLSRVLGPELAGCQLLLV